MSTAADPPAVNEIPAVPSPYEGRRLGFLDHIKLSLFWFGSNLIWGAFLGPVLAQQMTVLAPKNTSQALGYLYSLGALPALLVPLIIGALSDRCTSRFGRRRPYIAWGGVIGIGGLSLMLMAANQLSLPLYFAGYLVLQLGMNTAIAAFSGIIPDQVPENQRGTASGYMAVMSNVATLIGGVGSGLLVGDNPPLVYTLLIIVFGFFLILSVWGIKENRLEGPVPKMRWKPYFRSLYQVLIDFRDFRWVWITRFLMMLGFYAVSPYILYYLRDKLGILQPSAEAGIVMGLILVGATISGLIGGAISDRTGRKPIVYVASGIMAVMILSFIFFRTLEAALVAGLLFGIGYGAYISVDWALGADVLPSKVDAAKDMAVWHVAMVLPQQIAPLISGELLARNAYDPSEAFAKFSVPIVPEAVLQAAGGAPRPLMDLLETKQHYTPAGFTWVFVFSAIFFALSAVLLKNVRGAR